MAERNQLPVRRQAGIWNPIREFSRLHRGIDRLFDDLFGVTPSPSLTGLDMESMMFNPPMDVRDQDNQIVVSMDLPGIKKEDVKIEVQNNMLMISGERKEEREDRERGRQYSERFYGSFQRMLTLPGNVNPDQIHANYENGVLEIRLPKAESSKARRIEIGAGARPGLTQGQAQQQAQAKQPAGQKRTA